ncbi:valine--tRNA ligase [Devosia neptuniae]|jgi:valyl-tRNA synthetase|uniref:valine--tRNA ligase n=1 Tax=Devosia TaxID=46913 RepID=UPI0022AF2883|nr:valine--tRNA ligase [Devosia neptuniae]MCZ4346301.1 valine--tRNA ligase [Devosia neptuniae]|tara:strand:+ start:38550 stop:41306 length:2757 start_codon:yes stop_codon:yes gene_type:complete
MLEKSYEPGAVENRVYADWLKADAFAAGAGAAPGAETFTIVIPPPNVTGSLHIGHALNNTIQDILVRFNRMLKKDVLWQPGTDHAGIATQMIVERQLMERQQPGRREMGREKFVERVWEWKSESGGTIMNQLKRLGASADFSRERFTMGENGAPDDQMVRAVTKVFVELHSRGLIYRAKRLVNWHPGLETAISDLEVENIEIKGHMWHLRYPLADGVTYQFPIVDEEGNVTGHETRDYIIVATTRPETMLGDSGIAVHPEDERYAALVGKFVDLPLVGRRIPIVADEYADPELGTGAVKITPAHDFNDFEVGVRNDLEQINVFTTAGNIIDAEFVPEKYRGLERFAARKAIVDDLTALAEDNETRGLDHIEAKKIMVPHDEKTKLVVIEPFLTDQWWVKADVLAKPALAAVREGRTKFVPQQYENTYFAWLENIKPWCISRQLWWGHQIPAWYGPDQEAFVASSAEEAQALADAHYGKPVELRRDEDVLDTWFSSALWPFSTLGWPDDTAELRRYYPTDVLVTGFDIIFFWVARMMMMGLEFLDEEPFHTVYMHALVRDEKGQKMSKTKGNVIDPLALIDQYGADATRFTLAAMAAQGRDLKLSMSRVEGYRNFVTKIWNAARFLEMNECRRVEGYDPRANKLPLNRWIVGATARGAAAVTQGIVDYKFNEAANAAYDFVWGTFCDWYVEFAKPVFMGEDEAAKAETRATAAWALDQILTILNPFMPFVTEELWAETGKFGAPRESMLILTQWPDLAGLEDAEADADLTWLIDVITNVRSVRSEMNVPASAKLPLVVVGANETTLRRLVAGTSLITRLARLEEITPKSDVPGESAQFVVGEATWALPLAEFIDIPTEKARLSKEVTKLDGEVAQIDKKLGNEQFVAKAPEEVIEEQKARREAAIERRHHIAEALKRLS